MKNLLLLAILGAALAGCSGGSDVSSDGVRSKEQQIEDATKKLNQGQAPPQDQQ